MPALEAIGLRKQYRGSSRPALDGLDLRIDRGAGFGLIGLNGAGKTTFIKTLLGVVRPSAGTIRVLDGSPGDRGIRARIGYLPEHLQLPHAWRAAEFLASIARLKGLRAHDDEVQRQLGRVGLLGVTAKIGSYSKGMKQRLGLACALLGEPELLILDEPTDGIDPLGRAEVRRILQQERSRGATVFLNSHLLSETVRVCDRIGILVGGRLAKEGQLDALLGNGIRHRLRFAPGADLHRLLAAGFSPSDEADVYHCDAADPAALAQRLDAARAAGALLVELSQAQRDLEELLAEAVEIAA